MAKTVRETIKEITRTHLSNGSRCFGQCLTAVGWVGGTLPELYEEDGMVELSMADVAGGGILAGLALAGERHSIYDRMPGGKIVSPMTPKEWEHAYAEFMKDDEVYYFSEHRLSYDNAVEFEQVIHPKADVTLFPISITRFAAEEARDELLAEGIKVNIIHQVWIKPFVMETEWKIALDNSKYGGIVLDDDYTQGVATSIAHQMMMDTNSKVDVMGLRNRTAGFHPDVDNLPPSKADIIKKVKEMCNV